MNYESLLINLIASIIVAVVTVQLSIKEFYKQQIWLRKETRYSQIINDISILQKHYGDVLDEYMGIKKKGNSYTDLEKEHIISRFQLELVTLSQGFLLKKEVSEVLSQLFISANNKTHDESMGDWFAYFDRMNHEINKAREEIIKIANEDLKL